MRVNIISNQFIYIVLVVVVATSIFLCVMNCQNFYDSCLLV